MQFIDAMHKHFYIFRHGQCPLNISNHIQGQRFNGNLTPIGKLQALKTGEKLKNKNKSYYDLNSDKQPALKNIVLACRFYASILITYNLAKNRCLTDLFIFFFTLFKAMHIT